MHRFSNRELLDNISLRLALSDQKDARFIITESLGGDANYIRDSYFKLQKTFGQDIAKSTVVFLTKPNMAN